LLGFGIVLLAIPKSGSETVAKPKIRWGFEVKPGDVIADGPATQAARGTRRECAGGLHALVWLRDAIIIVDERLIRDDYHTSIYIYHTSIYIEEFELTAPGYQGQVGNAGHSERF